jgi:hypothetical protein
MILASQNCIHEGIKSRLNSGNAYYHSVQNFFVFLLSGNIEIKVYRTVIFPVVLYGCETWSHTLRKEHRLRLFENRVQCRVSGPKMDEIMGAGGNGIMRSFIICTLAKYCQNEQIKEDEMDRACSMNGSEVHTECW